MKYWGITGTNGKTTTTWIFAEFLNATPGRKCGYVTTVEVNTGSRRFYTGYTTPPLKQLKEIFAEMEANGCTDCVMEVSSHAIHQHRTGDTVFSGGAFTNLSEDHLDYHKTMEAYFDVKLDFARQIAEQSERRLTQEDIRGTERVSEAERAESRAPYVVCLDGGYGQEMFNAVGNLAVNVIGVSCGANERALTGGTRETGAARGYDLTGLQLVGDYNRDNVLVAAALAEASGVPHETIQALIPTLKPRWGRLELVENPNVRAKVYVDFAHTPDGLEKVLAAVRGEMEKDRRPKVKGREVGQGERSRSTVDDKFHCLTSDLGPLTSSQTSDLGPLTSSRPSLWIVFGAGGDRDPMKRPLMGAACAKLADRLVVTSDNPRSEDPMKIIDAIMDGVNEVRGQRSEVCGGNGVHVEPDRKVAIEFALSNARAGDVVIIAGKGHETTQEIKGVRYPFDDREIVRQRP